MTLGEIKAQALMLMGVNNSLNISWGDIDTYKDDPSYATYIHAMNGAINRCMKRMYIAGALSLEPLNVEQDSDEATEMTEFAKDMTNTLADMIPLYVVGDVFAMEEPSVAENRRNEFEMLLEEYVNKRTFPAQDKVEIIYGV
jgi:hypothetical protein